MSESITKPISQFSLPELRNYRWFAGSCKADDNFWYGEFPEYGSEGFDSKVHTSHYLNSIYESQVHCVFGFFKQPGEDRHMEIDEILGITDIMYVTDLKVPPKQYTMYNRGNDIPQKFENMIAGLGAKDIIEGEIRIVRADDIMPSEDTQKNIANGIEIEQSLSIDPELYAMFRKK
ncbi:hypothetical protein GQ473_05870 [archaeon]|nr:hypothetical protein [archaeon]